LTGKIPIPVDDGLTNLYRLYPSRIYSALLLFVYSLTLLIIFILPIAGFITAAFSVLLLWALLYYLRRDAWLLLSSSPAAIRLLGKDITLLTRDGREWHGQILGDSLVTPVLTILNIWLPGTKSRRSVVIFPDSLEMERFRELRVKLKWGG
jgi:toxin CptA